VRRSSSWPVYDPARAPSHAPGRGRTDTDVFELR
jgi:hypothetical protein